MEYSAYEQGFRAYGEGRTMLSCRFRVGSTAHTGWVAGWRAARKADLDPASARTTGLSSRNVTKRKDHRQLIADRLAP